MSFLFRAVLVIGALTYFAAQRQGRTVSTADVVASLRPSTTDVAQAWNAIPTDARERISREATAELGRRIAAMQPSEDTLGSNDRKPAWQGPATR